VTKFKTNLEKGEVNSNEFTGQLMFIPVEYYLIQKTNSIISETKNTLLHMKTLLMI
jgi:hypothetical protein